MMSGVNEWSSVWHPRIQERQQPVFPQWMYVPERSPDLGVPPAGGPFTNILGYQFNRLDDQGNPIMPSTEFNAVTIYLTNDELAEARAGNLPKATMIARITEALPAHVEITPGMRYVYTQTELDRPEDGYEVVRVLNGEALVRRLSHSSCGPVGSTFVKEVSKIEADILQGRTEVI